MILINNTPHIFGWKESVKAASCNALLKQGGEILHW